MFLSKRDLALGAGSAGCLNAIGLSDTWARPTRRNVLTVPKDGLALTTGDEIMALLATTPYVEFGTKGPILYDVSFRACGPCIAFVREGKPALVRAGYRVRSFVHVPRPLGRERMRPTPGESASVAHIYQTQNPTYFDAWFRSNDISGFARSQGIGNFVADSVSARSIQSGQEKVNILDALVKSGGVPQGIAFPAFFWARGDKVKAMFGYSQPQFLIQMMAAG